MVFDCPEVVLCGWLNVIISYCLTNLVKDHLQISKI